MIRYGILPIQDVLAKIGSHKHVFEINGRKFFVKMGSQRYKLFQKSLTCVNCKRDGHYFALETHAEQIVWGAKLISNAYEKLHYRMHPFYIAHFNLYSLSEKGREDILMTKDHILPVSRGGGNTMSNYQVMCSLCNNKKGNSTGSKFPKAEKFLYDLEKSRK